MFVVFTVLLKKNQKNEWGKCLGLPHTGYGPGSCKYAHLLTYPFAFINAIEFNETHLWRDNETTKTKKESGCFAQPWSENVFLFCWHIPYTMFGINWKKRGNMLFIIEIFDVLFNFDSILAQRKKFELKFVVSLQFRLQWTEVELLTKINSS